jgi:hypothetical protein
MNARPVRLDRIHHVPRELLRSRDFRDALEADSQLQWWHQRAVHDSFGIVEGLAVELGTDTGSVVVAPGVAFDCFGRELQLFEQRIVSIPEEAVRMTLLARYPRGREVHRVSAGCGCRAGHGEADLLWRETARVDARAGVPLALLDPNGDPQLEAVSVRARALARPRVGAGATQPNGTPWQPFRRPETIRAFDGVEVRVDTRAVGFTDTPCYFAWLHWPRLASAVHPAAIVFGLGLQSVEKCSIDGFTFRVWLGLVLRPAFGEELLSIARSQQLHVSWLGVQTEDQTHGPPSAKGKA